MAEFSYNGWVAGRTAAEIPGGLEQIIVAGESFAPGVRRGAVAIVLRYVAEQMHKRVEPIIAEGWHDADDWGYNYRTNRNANNLSCHASGTAIDYNATRHPNKKRGTFNPGQVAGIRAILAEVNHVVRWGGDFSGTKDEMHFEICANAGQVEAVARRIQERQENLNAGEIQIDPVVHEIKPAPSRQAGIGDVLEYNSSGPVVTAWQGELWRLGYGVGFHDGEFGPATKEQTRLFQLAAGTLLVDGKVGPATRACAASVPTYPKPDGPALPFCSPDGPEETVRAFQQALKDRTWSIAVDGKYGEETRTKISQFQREKGLAVDGIGGPQVWTALHTRHL